MAKDLQTFLQIFRIESTLILVREGLGASVKHLLDETESSIKFVLPGQVMLGQAKQGRALCL